MNVDELVELPPDQKLGMKSTMYKESIGTTTYTASEACQHYLRMIQQDKDEKRAKVFVKDLELLQ